MTRAPLVVLGIAGLFAAFATSAQAAGVSGDFDGDGRADLAVDVEGQTVGGQLQAGAVQVIYGSRQGPSGKRDRIFTQNTPGVGETAESGDEFGNSLASGDFNGDGRADLAIGTPFEDVGALNDNAGVVQILYGSRRGLRPKGNQLLVQGKGGLKGSVASQNNFGWALAAANLGHGRQDDLAIGATRESVNGQDGAGAVQIVYGTRRGLRARHNQRFTQDTPQVPDAAEPGDHFGWSLAAADLGRGSRADLAIGARDEGVGTAPSAGAVHVLYGSRKGVRAQGSQFFTQDTPGVGDDAEQNDRFGSSLAAADFGRSGQGDLAIGAPGESVGSSNDAGALNVLYGSRAGLRATGGQLFTQDTLGIGDGSEFGDEFATSLAAANLGRGKRADLAVGVPHECVPAGLCVNAGAANVIYGSTQGLTANGAQALDQDTPGVKEVAEVGDQFGWAVTVGRFRGTKVADLAVGAPFDGVVNNGDGAGVVNVLRGSPGGITTSGNRLLAQGSGGLAGTPEPNEYFGSQLSGAKSTVIND
jgi:hypothetical protein